jgi:hypothetical protein
MTDVAPADEAAPELDPEVWDETGTQKNPKYSPAYAPTTTFHPLELPSNPLARAQINPALIDASSWTDSPGSDSAPEHRTERGLKSLKEAEAFFDAEAEKISAAIDSAKESLTAASGETSVAAGETTGDGATTPGTAEAVVGPENVTPETAAVPAPIPSSATTV